MKTTRASPRLPADRHVEVLDHRFVHRPHRQRVSAVGDPRDDEDKPAAGDYFRWAVRIKDPASGVPGVDQKHHHGKGAEAREGEHDRALGATAAAGALLVEIVVVISQKASDRLSDEADISRAFGGPEGIGRLFLTDHLLAFEITSIVLLAAAVGGVVLGSEVKRSEELEA